MEESLKRTYSAWMSQVDVDRKLKYINLLLAEAAFLSDEEVLCKIKEIVEHCDNLIEMYEENFKDQ